MFKDFFTRDKDITYKDEFAYIFICLKETINIFGMHIRDAALQKSRRTFVQPRSN